MSKSILIMDMPNACIDCPCHFAGTSGTVVCGKEKREILSDDIQTFKPDWCPLREAPSKKEDSLLYGAYVKGKVDGYNACIDEILKERD